MSGGAHLHGLTSRQHSSEETSQQWQAIGDTVFDLTDQLGNQSQTFHWWCAEQLSEPAV